MKAFRKDDDVLYSETVPKLWDIADEEARAVMCQWTTFEPNMPGVKCELQIQRPADDRWGKARNRPQEVPAC